MTDENKSASLYQRHRSMAIVGEVGDKALTYTLAPAVQYELSVIMSLGQIIRPEDYRRNLQHKDDWTSARIIAQVEAATVLCYNPELLYLSPEYGHFTPLYRLLRSYECTGQLKRGGNSMLIGSGVTIPEALALYMQPPTEAMVTSVLQDKNPLDRFNRYGEKYSSVRPVYPSSPFRYLDGKVIAIEPDTDVIEDTPDRKKLVGMPPDKLSIHPFTIGEAIDQQLFNPARYDTILWHRADPQVITEKKDVRQQEADYATLFSHILPALRPNGTFIMTTGLGNNAADRKARAEMLARLPKTLGSIDNSLSIEAHSSIEDSTNRILFGNTLGMTGYVLARK